MERRSQRYSAPFVIIAVMFTTALVVSNIIAVKLVRIGWLAGIGELVIPAGAVIFPVSAILGLVLTEVYGYAAARRVIWLGFACNLLAVIAIEIGQVLPPASSWPDQEAYQSTLGYTPRILVASFTAFLAGGFLNCFVLAKLKVVTTGRWLWLRTTCSMLASQGVDNVIFITLAFAGVVTGGTLVQAIITHWIFQSGYEIAATPLIYVIVRYLKRLEGMDTYDHNTNFNPLAM